MRRTRRMITASPARKNSVADGVGECVREVATYGQTTRAQHDDDRTSHAAAAAATATRALATIDMTALYLSFSICRYTWVPKGLLN